MSAPKLTAAQVRALHERYAATEREIASLRDGDETRESLVALTEAEILLASLQAQIEACN